MISSKVFQGRTLLQTSLLLFPILAKLPCPVSENADKLVTEAAATASITLQNTEDAISSDEPVTDSLNESSGEMTRSGSAYDVFQKCLSNREQHSSPDEALYPDEEEAAFLRSLGWEENAGEDEGLTEDGSSRIFSFLVCFFTSSYHFSMFCEGQIHRYFRSSHFEHF
nr:hypothetical protein CFP56_73740 [Quercus suber]